VLLTILTTVLLSSTPSETELVLARFTHVGLDDALVKKARARVENELASAGAKLVRPAHGVDDACIQEPDCLRGAIGPHRGALVVDILRIGPMVSITGELYGADGEKVAAVEHATDTTAFDEGAAFLGEELLTPIRAMAPPVEVAPVATPTEKAPVPVATPTPKGGDEAFPLLPTVFLAGGGVIIASALAISIVSFVGMVSQAQVLQTPSTTTAEKDLAITLGRAALLGIGIGVAGIVVGAGVAAAGFFVE
jgi:hypothetical protein